MAIEWTEEDELRQVIEDARYARRAVFKAIRESGGLPPADCARFRKQAHSVRRELRMARSRLNAILSGRI